MEQESRFRRKDISSEEVEQMRQMEIEGKSRKQIALAFGCSPSAVTRHLGAVRQYGGKRIRLAA